MKPTTNTSFLRPLLNVLRVRKWIVLLALILVPVVAAVASSLQSPEYEASSQVLISRTNLSNVLTGTSDPAAAEFDFNRVVQTQANLARTPRVAKRTLAAAKLDPADFQDFLAHSAVATSPNNDLLTMTVSDGQRQRAIGLAGQYAREFVAYRQAASTRRLVSLRDDLQRQYIALDKRSAEAKDNRDQYNRVRNLLALGDSSLSVVQTPSAAEKTKPKTTRNIILGIILGAMLGVGLAFLRDALDTRLRTSAELEENLKPSLLGRLPSPPRGLGDDALVTLADPGSPDAEHFRVLRSSVVFANSGPKARSILITSAVQSEGKSTTIANLAVAMARAGQNVVLADFDFRRPSLERLFALSRRPGAIDVVLGEATLDEALQAIDLTPPAAPPAKGATTPGNGRTSSRRASLTSPGTLRVLTTGDLPPAVGEFVTSDGVVSLLEDLAATCDVLLIDAPPLLAVGDAIALTDHVDALLIVARLGVVRRHMLEEVQRMLDASPTPALGLVITDSSVEPGSYEGYGYGYPSAAEEARTSRRGRKRGESKPPTAGVS